MEFRTSRTPPQSHGIQSQAFRSVSQHTLSGDHQKTSSAGLRKLAASIRGTARGVGVEHERFRSTSREKATLADPRFRRERTRSPKKASQSRSESQFTPNYEKKTNTHSSTPAINKTLTFAKAPELPPLPPPSLLPTKQHHQQQAVQVEVEVRKKNQHFSTNEKKTAPEAASMMTVKKQKEEEGEEEEEEEMMNDRDDALVSVSLENHVNSLVKSLLSNEDEEEEEEEEEEVDQKISSRDKNNQEKEDSAVSSKSSVSFKRRRNSWGGNQARNAFNEDPRILKKYAYLLARGAKRTGSVENVNASYQIQSQAQPQPKRAKMSSSSPVAPPRDRCPCVKCTTIEFDPEDVLKEHFKMPVLFLTGSGIAVVLMAFIAWILSNDFIWNLVNNVNNNKEAERRNTLLYTAVSYIGGAALFTINLIFGGIYNLFVLPRNAVFKSADEPWTPWQYINLK